VSGDVDVLDGLFFQNISVFEKQLTGRVLGAFQRKTEAYQSTLVEQMPELEDMRFELMVRARDGFKVRNQIERFDLDLELRMELLFSNTLAAPRLNGDVEVLDGTVIFQGEQFQVRSGVVRFSGPMENPYIDVVAGADIRNTCSGSRTNNTFTQALTMSNGSQNSDQQQSYYHISLNVRGAMDSLNILYESVPYADQRDVISLILTGCTVDQLTASSASQPTLEIALGPLIGRLEREIQDVIKVEEFTIMPGVEVTQLRISDRISRSLSWNFQLDTGLSDATRGQFFQLEYALTEQWAAQLAESTRTENNQLMIDLRLKYHLPLD
jgi:translocation and assembly module TamB